MAWFFALRASLHQSPQFPCLVLISSHLVHRRLPDPRVLPSDLRRTSHIKAQLTVNLLDNVQTDRSSEDRREGQRAGGLSLGGPDSDGRTSGHFLENEQGNREREEVDAHDEMGT